MSTARRTFRRGLLTASLIPLLLFCVGTASAAWRAGLKEGTLTSKSSMDTTTQPTTWNIVMSPIAGGTTGWGDNTVKVYQGQIYLDGSQYWFGECIDDATWLKIDGTVLINDSTWNNFATGTITRDAGWYDFEVRFQNGGGGCGVANSSKDMNGRMCGFGYCKGSTKPASMTACLYPEDDGTMSLFRYDDGKGAAEGDILVEGDPFELEAGQVVPDYGNHTGYESGKSYTCTAPSTHYTNDAQTVSWAITGYSLKTNGVLWAEGKGCTCTFTYPENTGVEVIWQWDLRYLVTAAAKGGGSVTNAMEWVAYGETFNSRAVADEGRIFRKWTNASGTTIGTDVDLALRVTAPLTNTAYFSGSVAYVTTNTANEAVFPYATWDTAAHDLQTALAAGTDEIEVGEGTYVNTENWYTFDRAVKIYSSKGPSKTILQAKSDGHQFMMTHDGALLAGFTFSGGRGNHNRSPIKHVVNMSAGIVSNCVFSGYHYVGYANCWVASGSAKIYDTDFDGSGGFGSTWDNTAALVWMEGNALLDRCKIHNFNWPNYYKDNYKSAVVLNSSGAVLRNSLVYGNKNGSSSSGVGANVMGGGARLNYGTIENCTFAENYAAYYGGGIAAPNASGKIINCVVYGNTSRQGRSNDIWAPNLPADNISYTCASDVGDLFSISNGVGAGCTELNPQFSGEKPHPYALTAQSVGCVDRGTATDASQESGARDVMGNPRLDWKKELIDIGCYEFVPSADPVPLSANIDVTVPSGYGERTVQFVATPTGDNRDGLTYCWHFGDGQIDADSLTTSHLYQPGIYEVVLAITNNVGEATNVVCDTKITILPQTCYVSKTGNGIYPYDTWEKATNDVAVALAVGSAEVVVHDGVYTNSVYEHVISRGVHLHSLNGPTKTTLRRGSVTHLESGNYQPDRGRHFTISSSGAMVDGFTLDGGYGGFNTYCWFGVSAGVISNCVVKGAFRNNYGCYCTVSGSGRVVDCEFDASSNGYVYTTTDGGCYLLGITGSAVADRCVFHGYHAYTSTGSGNQSRSAIYVNGGTLRNSLVYDCSCGNNGVDSIFSGGGVRLDSGNVVNCTVVGCTSWGNGGGIWVNGNNGYVRNCIVWGNVQKGSAGKDIYAKGRTNGNILYTCASDVGDTNAIPESAQGAGCLAKDPLLRSITRRDYRIRASSPCLDAGDPTSYPDKTGLYDIRRLSRKEHEAVDMGCYEIKRMGFMLLVK